MAQEAGRREYRTASNFLSRSVADGERAWRSVRACCKRLLRLFLPHPGGALADPHTHPGGGRDCDDVLSCRRPPARFSVGASPGIRRSSVAADMTQVPIPFHSLHGGTLRKPYFRRSDLPVDEAASSEILMAVVGAGNPRNIDGVVGGNAVATKVALLSRSDEDAGDIDCFLAQVAVEDRLVNDRPSCGSILAGVGPAAIEMGLHEVENLETRVRIRAVNTGALVEAVVLTPGRPGDTRATGQATVSRGPVTITLLTRAGFCGMHDACRLACDSFARKRFRGLRARSGREARAGARLRASCALAQSGATRGASRAFRRRGRSCRGWRRSWG